MSEEEVSDWQKLPSPLQHQFYDEARSEAKRQLKELKALRTKLEEVFI